MRIGSLCTGYGGLDMACEAFFGGTTAWVSDIDKGACKILAHRYPDVPNIGDFTKIDWSQVEPVDVLTAGYPCQPFSHAGQRAGTNDERHLWPHVAEALAKLRPKYGVFENVRGHLSLGFDQVLRDLSQLGYHPQWHVLRAADVGAPHGRARIFLLATDQSADRPTLRRRVVPAGGLTVRTDPVHRADPNVGPGGGGTDVRDPDGFVYDADLVLVAADTERGGRDGRDELCVNCGNWADNIWRFCALGRHRYCDLCAGRGRSASCRLCAAADASGERHGRRQDRREVGRVDSRAEGEARQRERTRTESGDRSAAAAADTDRDGLESVGRVLPVGRHVDRRSGADVAWGAYEPAIRRWEAVLGRVAPAPTETSPKGAQRLSPRFVEWMQGLPEGHVTNVPGLTRNEQLKALGNGVVPQQALAALQIMAGGVRAEVAA